MAKPPHKITPAKIEAMYNIDNIHERLQFGINSFREQLREPTEIIMSPSLRKILMNHHKELSSNKEKINDAIYMGIPIKTDSRIDINTFYIK
jgi:hypothetical protein